VAWTSYGIGGRAAILGGATLIAFAIPVVAVRRRLTATAETFTAIALLLLILDGYGLWALDVGGAADSLAGTTYAGGVAAVVAAVAAGFGRLLRLIGPRFVAIIAAQPALPLVLASHRTSGSAAAMCFAAVASANIAVIVWRRRANQPGRARWAERILTWVFALLALATATAVAGGSLIDAIHIGSVLGAAAAVAVVAAVLVWTGWFARPDYLRVAAVAAAVLEISVAAFRVGIVATPFYPLIVAAIVTLAVATSSRAVPKHW